MLVDMGAAMFFLYEIVYVLAEIINICEPNRPQNNRDFATYSESFPPL